MNKEDSDSEPDDEADKALDEEKLVKDDEKETEVTIGSPKKLVKTKNLTESPVKSKKLKTNEPVEEALIDKAVTKKTSKKEAFKTRELKFSDEESMSESENNLLALGDLDDYKLGGFSSDDNESDASDSNGDEDDDDEEDDDVVAETESVASEQTDPFKDLIAKTLKKKVVEKKVAKKPEPELEPLIFENKPNSRMVIKQFNMDDIKDFAEIPIQANSMESDTEDELKEDSSELDEEKSEDETKNKKKKSKKSFSISQDPFFLDQNGNEIENYEFDNERNESFKNRINDEFEENINKSYSSYDNYKDKFKRDNVNSSFRNSLSGESRPFRGSFRPERGGRGSFGRGGFNSERGSFGRGGFNSERGSFGRGAFYSDRGSYQSNRGGGYRSENNSYTKEYQPSNRGGFRTEPRGRFQPNNNGFKETKPAESMDTSKLHPSWQAKKQLEERSKLKFEGKKLKFDD